MSCVGARVLAPLRRDAKFWIMINQQALSCANAYRRLSTMRAILLEWRLFGVSVKARIPAFNLERGQNPCTQQRLLNVFRCIFHGSSERGQRLPHPPPPCAPYEKQIFYSLPSCIMHLCLASIALLPKLPFCRGRSRRRTCEGGGGSTCGN